MRYSCIIRESLRETFALGRKRMLHVLMRMRRADAITRMFAGEHASHLCHLPTCVNPDHLVVEAKGENEARKSCKGKVCHMLERPSVRAC